jgi:hypothetical protein
MNDEEQDQTVGIQNCTSRRKIILFFQTTILKKKNLLNTYSTVSLNEECIIM